MLAVLVQKQMLIPGGYGRGMTYKIDCSKRTVIRNMSKMKNIKYVGSGYSGNWEIE